MPGNFLFGRKDGEMSMAETSGTWVCVDMFDNVDGHTDMLRLIAQTKLHTERHEETVIS